jgi:hypothetical protein
MMEKVNVLLYLRSYSSAVGVLLPTNSSLNKLFIGIKYYLFIISAN